MTQLRSAKTVESRFVIECNYIIWPVGGSIASLYYWPVLQVISQQQNDNVCLHCADLFIETVISNY